MWWTHHPTVSEKLDSIQREIKHMSEALTVLTTAVTDLTAAVTTETANVTAAISAIAEAVKELANNDDPQVAALAQNIEAQVALINTANGNIAAATATLPATLPAA